MDKHETLFSAADAREYIKADIIRNHERPDWSVNPSKLAKDSASTLGGSFDSEGAEVGRSNLVQLNAEVLYDEAWKMALEGLLRPCRTSPASTFSYELTAKGRQDLLS